LKVLTLDDYANDVELNASDFMSLSKSMNYNIINMLLVVDVLNLYMLNVDVICGNDMYNIGDDEYFICNYWR